MNQKSGGQQGGRHSHRHPGTPSGKPPRQGGGPSQRDGGPARQGGGPAHQSGGYRPKQDRNPKGGRPHGNGGSGPNQGYRKGGGFERRELDPFEVFRIYHLGLVSDTHFKRLSLIDAARVFQVGANDLKNYMVRQGIDLDTIHRTEFDLELARLDIKVAPEGINKTEVARQLYNEFLEMRGPWVVVEDAPPSESDTDREPETVDVATMAPDAIPNDAEPSAGDPPVRALPHETWSAPGAMAKSNRG